MAEFRILPPGANLNLPGKCLLCNTSHLRDLYVIDTGCSDDWIGIYYLCQECLVGMMELLNKQLPPDSEVESLKEQLRESERRFGLLLGVFDSIHEFVHSPTFADAERDFLPPTAEPSADADDSIKDNGGFTLSPKPTADLRG